MNDKKGLPMGEPIKLDRSKVKIEKDAVVRCQEQIYRITEVLEFNEVIAVNLRTGKRKKLLTKFIKHAKTDDAASSNHMEKDSSEINTKEWDEVEKKLAAIAPFLDGSSTESIVSHAAKIGIHHSTLYNWLNNYIEEGSVAGLFSKKEGRREGNTRISSAAESIIQEVINTYYLTPQKTSVQDVINKVNSICYKLEIDPPSKNTIRRRIDNIDGYNLTKSRHGKAAARAKFSSAAKHFNADYPLEYVQIDHTEVDIMLVDEKTRESIGRPQITVMIDIYSRMIHGYFLSLDAPSATSVAMCIVNAVCDKEETLRDLNIDAEWNIWGFMHNLHSDNGADFHSKALKFGCRMYEVHLEKRPLIKTEFGGHIERVLGTLMKQTHNLPGTTKSNIQEKGIYDSEKESAMTFKEFEKWLVTFITKIYHKQEHRSLKMSPEQKWAQGYQDIDAESGEGLPSRPSHPQTILLDFLPFEKRSIQRNGINMDGLNYYDSVLRSFINSKKKYIIKRDPRDISHVWFYDDDKKQYYKIPFADQNLPSMTKGEWDTIKDKIKKTSKRNRVSNAEIIEAQDEMHRQVDEAIKHTKKQRRRNAQKHVGTDQQKRVMQKPNIPEVPQSVASDELWDESDIPDFYANKEIL